MKYIVTLAAFLFLTQCANNNVEKKEAAQCYWMENYSGKSRWVAAKEMLDKNYSNSECFKADSCNGGSNESGGCYKWSENAQSPALPWDNI